MIRLCCMAYNFFFTITLKVIFLKICLFDTQVSWTNAEGDQYHLYMKNESSVIISGLLPGSWYLITAVVVGVDLSDTVNVSTEAFINLHCKN